MPKLDLEEIRRITSQAKAKGLLQVAEPSQPEEIPHLPLGAMVELDFSVLNQVFDLRLNRMISPLRMIRAIHAKCTSMSEAERSAIPAAVKEMVEGLQRSLEDPFGDRQDSEPVNVKIQYISKTAALVEPAQSGQFTDLILRLDRSPGWVQVKKLLSQVAIGGTNMLIQGPLVAAVHDRDGKGSKHLKRVIESVQKFTNEHENIAAEILEGKYL